MSTSSAPAATAYFTSASLTSRLVRPLGNAVATLATCTPLPFSSAAATWARSGYTQTAATIGAVGSAGSGRLALAHSARTLPGVSWPSSVVRSIIEMAVSSAHCLAVVLMDRLASMAARASAPTRSTPGSPCRNPRSEASDQVRLRVRWRAHRRLPPLGSFLPAPRDVCSARKCRASQNVGATTDNAAMDLKGTICPGDRRCGRDRRRDRGTARRGGHARGHRRSGREGRAGHRRPDRRVVRPRGCQRPGPASARLSTPRPGRRTGQQRRRHRGAVLPGGGPGEVGADARTEPARGHARHAARPRPDARARRRRDHQHRLDRRAGNGQPRLTRVRGGQGRRGPVHGLPGAAARDDRRAGQLHLPGTGGHAGLAPVAGPDDAGRARGSSPGAVARRYRDGGDGIPHRRHPGRADHAVPRRGAGPAAPGHRRAAGVTRPDCSGRRAAGRRRFRV